MVQILLATLSDLPRPGAAALLVSLTAAHPNHLLVLRLLLLDVVPLLRLDDVERVLDQLGLPAGLDGSVLNMK